MWLTFAIILTSIVAFSLERIPMELTAGATLVALIVVFIIVPEFGSLPTPISLTALLLGFANPALFAILSLVIVGQGLFQTGALDRATQKIARSARLHGWTMIAMVFVAAAALSAFMNNTPVVVMLIPVLAGLSRIKRISPGRLLLPMNYATILGGSATLIGSSTNLLVADVAMRNAGLQLTMFSITVPGLVLAAFGMAYVILLVPRILRDTDTADDVAQSGKQFLTDVVLGDTHPLVGTACVAGHFPDLNNVTVRLLKRNGRVHFPPFEGIAFEPGDRIVFCGMRPDLADLNLFGEPRSDESNRMGRQSLSQAEAMVAPGSRIVGRPPNDSGLERDLGVQIVGVERRGHMRRGTFSDKRLEAGDVLLISGDEKAFDRLRGSRDLLVLERSVASLPARTGAQKAVAIFAGMVILAATEIVSIPVAAITAAFLMIAFGCLNIRQAKRAFDSRIFMLVGTSIASATALQATGGAMFLAESLVSALEGAGPAVLLSALFALIAILTNALSNNATAVLFTPVAISVAQSAGVPVEPFVIAVIFAANASFATPIGYQTNLLVLGPGGYRYRDYLCAGGPLVILLWAVFTIFAPWYYGLS